MLAGFCRGGTVNGFAGSSGIFYLARPKFTSGNSSSPLDAVRTASMVLMIAW
jgi:hypothetical protein